METNNHRAGGRTACFLAVAILMMVGVPRADAQEQPAASSSGITVGQALAATLSKGVPTVVVFTSESQPGSIRVWNEFNETAWARTNRGLVQLVRVSKEHEVGFVRSSGIVQFPSVVVYARGPKGVTVLSSIQDCADASSLVSRMISLSVGMEPMAAVDPSVRPATYPGDAYPSQQYQQPTTSSPPPASPPAMTSQPMVTVAMPQTVSATTGMIQVPGQNLMIQQQPTQVYMAPAPQPVVYVPQTMPSMSFVPQTASPPAGNLYLTTSAPAPAPTMAVAVANQPAVTPTAVALTTAAPPALAAVNNQTFSLPSSASRTRVRVRGPGLVASSLARLGEKMTQLGRARIETVQETELQSPYTQNLSGGLTTFNSTSTTPISQPQTMMMTTPAPAPQPPVCQPPNPTPTPQASPQRSGGR
jgi:hypothetical protein